MTPSREKTDRLLAALITLLVTALCVVTLCIVTISATHHSLTECADENDDNEILFTDVELKAIPFKPIKSPDNRPAASAAAEVSGTDASDSGSGEESTPLLTANDPQPAQQAVKEDPKPTAKPQPKPDPREEAMARIRNRIGSSNVTKADEGTGSADHGNAPVGQTNSSRADGLGMDGRQLLNRPVPSITNATGRVTVNITVNAEGHVTAATVTGTSGFGSREKEVRDACLSASRQLRYSPEPSRPTQRGTITWIIK